MPAPHHHRVSHSSARATNAQQKRWRWALLGALTLHVIVAASVLGLGEPVKSSSTALLDAPELLMWDLKEPESPTGTEPGADRGLVPSLPDVAAAAAGLSGRALTPAENALSANADAPSIDESGSAPLPSTVQSATEQAAAQQAATQQAAGDGKPPKDGARRLSLAQLGVGPGAYVAPVWDALPRSAPADRKPPDAQERVRKMFAEGAAQEQQRLGLGAAGQVKGALLRATQSANMTGEGQALFTFTFGDGGKLSDTQFRVLGGKPEDWARVAATVKRNLTSDPPDLPAGSRGARMSYSVDFSYRYPSGSKGGGPKWSLTQSFDVADIGKDRQAVTHVTLSSSEVF